MKPPVPGSIAGLSFGILSLMAWPMPVLGFVLGLCSIWNARRAQQEGRRQPELYQDGSLTSAAMVCGVIGTVISALWNLTLLLLLALLATLAASVAHQQALPGPLTPML